MLITCSLFVCRIVKATTDLLVSSPPCLAKWRIANCIDRLGEANQSPCISTLEFSLMKSVPHGLV